MNKATKLLRLWNARIPILSPQKLFGTTTANKFIFKTLDDVKNEDMVRYIGGDCESRRYLLRKDQMGFSFHHTVFYGGREKFINYKNHMEAVFIASGKGWIEVVSDRSEKGKGKRFELGPGTMYALNGHESHFLGAYEGHDMDCICVFVPPCSGEEIQNEDGVFPYVGEDGVPDYDFWAKKKSRQEPITIEIKDEQMRTTK